MKRGVFLIGMDGLMDEQIDAWTILSLKII